MSNKHVLHGMDANYVVMC